MLKIIFYPLYAIMFSKMIYKGFNEMYVFKVTWNFRQLLPFALAKFKAQTFGILRIQSLDTCIILEKTVSEKQFGQKRKSMPNMHYFRPGHE